ncbi:hypothetical protein HG536_0A08320 [Torulaspora globosa]|uniref:Uncharacterized protein n=1 Tax=Torulaspora globosa TaxID=48254 RepID=A0A7G3ZBY1_9SACH|nr:uncharacterized protein HG536_0A08320 [Torulaspora globosa]QLL31017.1 hypothetical protein HG536_0A08320 [Torulaspora globosa]
MSTNASVKSFQNCLETEVPGYNDCPSFLYQVNKVSARGGRRNRIAAKVRDICGNTTAPSMPPPLTNSTAKETDDEGHSQIMSKEEVLAKVRDVYNAESKLSVQEFEFYRRKVDLNMTKSLDSESTRRVLTTVLEELEDKDRCARILREWLTSDVTISSWCPAFLKIYENASII